MNTGLRLIHNTTSAWDPKTPQADPRTTGPFFLNDVTGWKNPVTARLEELVHLQRGWDGYGGLPVGFTNAYFALRMLESTCRSRTEPPQIVPGPSGDLQIEWHTLKGDIELHVLAPHKVYGWFERASDGAQEEIELTNDFTRVAQWVKEITEPPIAVSAAAA